MDRLSPLILAVVVCGCDNPGAERGTHTEADAIPDVAEETVAMPIRVHESVEDRSAIQVGDAVDIRAVYIDPITGSKLSSILAQDAKVLALDNQESTHSNATWKFITLAVKPIQTNVLVIASTQSGVELSITSVSEVSSNAPKLGDYWLPGEFEKLLQERQRLRP